jgi:hypothetical protein
MIPAILLLQPLQGRYVAKISHKKRRCRYLVFLDELLRHILEAYLTHFLESVADILLNKFAFCVRSKWWKRDFSRLARAEGEHARLCAGRYLLGSSGRCKTEERVSV